MHAIVCIKQVPDTNEVRIDPERGTLIREGVPSIINPFDMYAIEEGILLKENHEGKATVVTMGPPQALEAIKEAVAMGCDDAVLISDRTFSGADTWATAYTLAQAIRKLGEYDVILCGRQAADGDTGQVGPGIEIPAPAATQEPHPSTAIKHVGGGASDRRWQPIAVSCSAPGVLRYAAWWRPDGDSVLTMAAAWP